MTLAILAAGTLPQSARLSPEQQLGWKTDWSYTSSWLDSLGLYQIVGSWWFKGLCILLVLNMVAGIIVSAGRKLDFYRGRWEPKYEASGAGAPPEISPPLVKDLPPVGDTVVRVQGVPGLFGLTFFHLGIAVIVLAGFWRGMVDFSDFFELSQGEVFSGQPHKFQRRQGPPEPFNAVLRLDRAEITVRDDKYMGEFKGHFSYKQGDGPVRQATVVSNQPLRLGGFELYPKQSFGHSAWLERLAPDGTLSVLYIHFNVERKEWGKPWSGEKESMLRLDGIPLYYTMALSSGAPPTFDLKVSQGEQVLYQGRLRPGEVADLGPYKLRFMGIVPWMTFNLAMDRGVWPVFAGFIITLLGYLLHLLFRPRRVELTVTEDSWTVRAWVRRGDDVFEKKWASWLRQQGQGSS